MKIGRNDPCPCGSGKKYKKCCLIKDELAQSDNQPPPEPEDDEFKSLFSAENLAMAFHKIMANILSRKPHIKEYKRIRKMHSDIANSMIDYYQDGKFEQRIDPVAERETATARQKGKRAEIHQHHELTFDMESDRGVQAFYDMLIYKISPNVSCITEDFINSHRYRKPEKVEFLQSMLNSKLGLFDVIGKDPREGYAYIKDVLSGKEYTLTDMGLSSDMNDEFLFYTRVITYRGVNFGTGLSLPFDKDDPFIEGFIKRHKDSYHTTAEFGRFAELYKHFCQTPSNIKIIANKFES